MNLRAALATLALCALAYATFRRSRDRARGSRRARSGSMARALTMVAAGALMVFWLPSRVPVTDGSPATTVAVAFLWVVGGCLALGGLIALAGAASTRPWPDDAPGPGG